LKKGRGHFLHHRGGKKILRRGGGREGPIRKCSSHLAGRAERVECKRPTPPKRREGSSRKAAVRKPSGRPVLKKKGNYWSKKKDSMIFCERGGPKREAVAVWKHIMNAHIKQGGGRTFLEYRKNRASDKDGGGSPEGRWNQTPTKK